MNLLIKNISYLDIDQEKIIDNADILVEENKIKKIGRDLDVKADQVLMARTNFLHRVL